MNIREAKEEIKNAMVAYFTKNEYGRYVIPIQRQRPVFLMGPSGIGKTAIMEQIAQELDVGLVSYSMTHHTRQSALGLPYIEKKIYGGEEYDISEYTMSEIIAAVYDMVEETGRQEGILFLDEINCVSETLVPAMLQFLQYKTFGRHRIPDGWIVVTAGNPPEYNSSVHEFDIVTWDRLKRIDVEPNFEVWKEYAYQNGIHPAIISYLDIKRGDFYSVETTVDGKHFVTARGWSDLSDMIRLYEQHDIAVTEKLIRQYLQNAKIARDFSVYYDLYLKYRSDYQVDQILAGHAPGEICARAASAKFDERLALLSLLLEGIMAPLREVSQQEKILTEYMSALKRMRELLKKGDAPAEVMQTVLAETGEKLSVKKRSGALSGEDEDALLAALRLLGDNEAHLQSGNVTDAKEAFGICKAVFDQKKQELKVLVEDASAKLDHLFAFCELVFPEGQEILILVTELTISPHSASFIGKYGCDRYFAHNRELMFYERKKEIIQKLEEEEWDLQDDE